MRDTPYCNGLKSNLGPAGLEVHCYDFKMKGPCRLFAPSPPTPPSPPMPPARPPPPPPVPASPRWQVGAGGIRRFPKVPRKDAAKSMAHFEPPQCGASANRVGCVGVPKVTLQGALTSTPTTNYLGAAVPDCTKFATRPGCTLNAPSVDSERAAIPQEHEFPVFTSVPCPPRQNPKQTLIICSASLAVASC